MKNDFTIKALMAVLIAIGATSSAFAAGSSTCEDKYKAKIGELNKDLNDLKDSYQYLAVRSKRSATNVNFEVAFHCLAKTGLELNSLDAERQCEAEALAGTLSGYAVEDSDKRIPTMDYRGIPFSQQRIDKIKDILAKIDKTMVQEENLRIVYNLKFSDFGSSPNKHLLSETLMAELKNTMRDPRIDHWMTIELVSQFPENELCGADGTPMTFTSFIRRFVQIAPDKVDKIEAILTEARKKDRQAWSWF